MAPMYEYLRELNISPTRVLDIGAHHGFWTQNCKKFWPDAHYTLIEAGDHRDKLEKFSDDVHIEVLFDKETEIKMYHNSKGFTKGASMRDVMPNWTMRKTKKLESVVSGRYEVIKQDVQGAEMSIMLGSPDIFRQADYVINEVLIVDVPAMSAFMKTLGFNKNEYISPIINGETDIIYWKG